MKCFRPISAFVVAGALLLLDIPLNTDAQADELESLLRTIRDVKSDGTGNREAAEAWRHVVTTDADKLPTVLAALDGAGPLAANWLRAAVDTISQRELVGNGKLPSAMLERFVLETRHDPRARRLAYQWLARGDDTVADRLIPRLLHDPSVEFRRDSVARLVRQAETLQSQDRDHAAIKVYRTALAAARDKDQIDTIAEHLRRVDQVVNLPRHFGFLMNWNVIGAFDNTKRTGFARDYRPEYELDLSAEYEGKRGQVSWSKYSTTDDYGMVDLNKALGSMKEAVGYAWTSFTAVREQQVELRLGCKNAWKLWLNGDLVFARDEYHRGMQLDQYRMPVTLKSGPNDILVKACQNEEEESWTVEWQFQLRVCDSTGTAILSTTRD